MQTLLKIASGQRQTDIAQELMLSPKTVSVYSCRLSLVRHAIPPILGLFPLDLFMYRYVCFHVIDGTVKGESNVINKTEVLQNGR